MSPTGNAFDDVCDKLHALADEMVAGEHKFGARLKSLVGQLTGDVPVLEAKAQADAAALGDQAAHDVEAAVAPPADPKATA